MADLTDTNRGLGCGTMMLILWIIVQGCQSRYRDVEMQKRLEYISERVNDLHEPVTP